MTTPSYAAWRTTSEANNSLPVQTLRERLLWALAAFVTNTNPDGTTRGS